MKRLKLIFLLISKLQKKTQWTIFNCIWLNAKWIGRLSHLYKLSLWKLSGPIAFMKKTTTLNNTLSDSNNEYRMMIVNKTGKIINQSSKVTHGIIKTIFFVISWKLVILSFAYIDFMREIKGEIRWNAIGYKENFCNDFFLFWKWQFFYLWK